MLAEVRAAATGDGPMNPRIATLLCRGRAEPAVEVVAPARSDRAKAKQRIAAAAEQVPAAAVVKHVIQSMEAAIAIAADSDSRGQQQLTTSAAPRYTVPSGRRLRPVVDQTLNCFFEGQFRDLFGCEPQRVNEPTSRRTSRLGAASP